MCVAGLHCTVPKWTGAWTQMHTTIAYNRPPPNTSISLLALKEGIADNGSQHSVLSLKLHRYIQQDAHICTKHWHTMIVTVVSNKSYNLITYTYILPHAMGIT